MVNVELSFGPMLIGVFFNMILYGVFLVQIYHYYVTFKKDVPWIRYLVIYLFVIETLNTGCDMAIMYQPLIQNFGLPDATKYFPTLFAAEPIVIVAVSTPIQIFFAWRIKLLTKSNLLACIVVFLAVASFVGGTYTTVLVVKVKLFARKPELHWPALVWFLSACLADIAITSVLVYTLSRKKTGFVATDDAISKIIRMTVQTGMLTAFFALADVVFFMTLPHTAINFVWDLCLSKLYANCLLSTLNAREHLQEIAFSSGGARKNGISGSGGRRQDTNEEPQHILYELDSQKGRRENIIAGDIEYGVTITKASEYSLSQSESHPHSYAI